MLEVILFIINTPMVHGRVGQSMQSTERQAEDPRINHILLEAWKSQSLTGPKRSVNIWRAFSVE